MGGSISRLASVTSAASAAAGNCSISASSYNTLVILPCRTGTAHTSENSVRLLSRASESEQEAILSGDDGEVGDSSSSGSGCSEFRYRATDKPIAPRGTPTRIDARCSQRMVPCDARGSMAATNSIATQCRLAGSSKGTPPPSKQQSARNEGCTGASSEQSVGGSGGGVSYLAVCRRFRAF